MSRMEYKVLTVRRWLGIVCCVIGMSILSGKVLFSQAFSMEEAEKSIEKKIEAFAEESIEHLKHVGDDIVHDAKKLIRGDAFYKEELTLIKGKKLKLMGIGLFAGSDGTSALIRKITLSLWSHCALILVDQDGILYCFESTGSYDEIMHHGVTPRVQIHLWDEVVKQYEGNVAMRHFFDSKPDDIPFVEMNTPEIVNELVMKYLNTPYEYNLVELLKAVMGDNKEGNLNSIFCSELVAQVLIDMGYLPKEKLSDNYLPKDFSSEMTLQLVNASLADETVVKMLGEEELSISDDRKYGRCSGCVMI